jgi:thiosulfate dehydrogenase
MPVLIILLSLAMPCLVETSRSASGESSKWPPFLDNFPIDERGQLIRYGQAIVVDTQGTVPGYVGNGLNCTNCHLQAGLTRGAATFVGLGLVYPEYRGRSGRVMTLDERLDECFERSLNGRPLPADSPEKKALLAYIGWLSHGVSREDTLSWRGLKLLAPTRRGDPVKGRELFASRCAACHGEDGQGTATGPPVWGPHSYNIAAGMARVSVAAAFIKANMPLGQGGTLTDEEAYDVAAFINAQPRPDFPGKVHDWPKGGKPADVPY